jgi:amidophosphoribosyltransferase
VDRFVDTSALFAVVGHRDAAALAVLGLHAQQHRGTGGAGLAVSDGNVVRFQVRAGPVHAGFDPAATEELPGSIALGQVFGRAELDAPLGEDDGQRIAYARHRGGPLAAAVSGHFTNAATVRRELLEAGALFSGASGAELLLHLVAASGQRTFVNRVVDALWRLKGAYSLLLLGDDHLVAVRDPAGFRPLVLGRLGEAHLLATDEGALRFVGADVRREVAPGEMLVIDQRGSLSVTPFPRADRRACAQEHVALARTDATVFGRPVHPARAAFGARLGQAHPCPDADLVCAAPGAEAAAIGYARSARLPYEHALLADPPVLRPLPEPPAGVPDLGSRVRWRAVPAVVRDRVVVLVAPSLTTGRSLRKMVRLLRGEGAAGVHVRIASPAIRGSCPYGVASPMPEELVLQRDDADPAEVLGARSLAWLPLDALRDELGSDVCEACFTHELPIAPDGGEDQLPLF